MRYSVFSRMGRYRARQQDLCYHVLESRRTVESVHVSSYPPFAPNNAREFVMTQIKRLSRQPLGHSNSMQVYAQDAGGLRQDEANNRYCGLLTNASMLTIKIRFSHPFGRHLEATNCRCCEGRGYGPDRHLWVKCRLAQQPFVKHCLHPKVPE